MKTHDNHRRVKGLGFLQNTRAQGEDEEFRRALFKMVSEFREKKV